MCVWLCSALTGHSQAGTHTAADAGSDKDNDSEKQYSDNNAHDSTSGQAKGWLKTCRKKKNDLYIVACIHTHDMHTHACIHTHACTHAHTHAHMHTHTHTCTHTHTTLIMIYSEKHPFHLGHLGSEVYHTID